MSEEAAFFEAIRNGDVPLVTQMVDLNRSILEKQRCGKMALEFAAEIGDRGMAEHLVRLGANPDHSKGYRNHSLLHSAVARSQYGVASILLDLGANPSQRSSNCSTPLHLAARMGQEYLAIKLIDKLADIDACDSQGRTPLMLAIEKGHEGTARILLGSGAKRDLVDKKGNTALKLARRRDFSDLIAELNECGLEESACSAFARCNFGQSFFRVP